MNMQREQQSAADHGGLRFSEETIAEMDRRNAESRKRREQDAAAARRASISENLVAAKVVFNNLDVMIGTRSA